MTIKGTPTRPQQSFWGKVGAKVAGLRGWKEHDHSVSWDDGGASDALGRDVAEKAKQIIADQTREAVAEYAADAEFALSARDGVLFVAINLTSAGSRLIVQVPFVDLVNKAVGDAYRSVANPASQEFLSTLIKTAGDMARLRQQMTSAPQPERVA